ncbi:MAG: class I SAM-dependent methyltransferase [Actinomycetota bacterium]|nr:class I SAM-dependent methyltransferase [Actinomycetota bacterium]
MNGAPACRSCGAQLRHTLVDLGEQPLANSYLTREQVESASERRYPLHARVCGECLLVQVDQVVVPEKIFSDYAYFSSYSASWLEHCATHAREVTERLALGPGSMVIEVASNDGYLLKNFVDTGIPVLGIEPAANVAEAAIAAGVPTEIAFFGRAVARAIAARGPAADLVVANNVLAHVPDLDDFVEGLAAVLKPAGVVSIEVPHLLRMIEGTEFDTIYHEHLSYFSLLAARDVLVRRGLRVFDVEELPTHGGSLRIWASRADAAETWPATASVDRVLAAERAAGLAAVEGYRTFAPRVETLIAELQRFLRDAETDGARVAAYGAAAKGNTLLNAAGVTTQEVAYVADRSPHKQGRFLPGSLLPVVEPEHVRRDRPDYLLVLPWNLRDEITEQMADVREWGCRFVVPIPRLEIVS